MPTKVTAVNGDTLCGLAIEAGFLDCAPLRADAANSAFLTRDLAAGDIVTIPDIDVREVARGTDTTHIFVAENAPPVRIRFTHGSPAIKYLQDADSTVLNVSNYKTTAAGRNANVPFPDQFEFQQPGHDDPDTFKVEVVDPAAGGTVNIVLEAMKPLYQLELDTNQLVVTGHVPFGAGVPTPDMRKIDMECKKVRSSVSFRSRYLRLVVDEKDFEAASGQTLLVSDMADGLGSGSPADNDTVEILDQQVRASYTRTACPGAAPNQCTVRAQLPIGEDRKRVRIAFHVFKSTRGGTPILNLTTQNMQRRLFKWWRRYYAQANLAPKLVAPGVEFIDPPDENMLVIGQDSGTSASGKTGKGAAASTLTVTISASSLPTGSQAIVASLTKGMTPLDVGEAVVAVLPANFKGELHENSRAFNARNGSCDLLITANDGSPVTLKASTDDTSLRLKGVIQIARVSPGITNPAAAGDDRVSSEVNSNNVISSNPDLRRIIYCSQGSADCINVYVIAAQMTRLAGIAFVPADDLKEDFRARVPLRHSIVIAGLVMDGTDDFPAVLPHECGHILGDVFHVEAFDAQHKIEVMSPKPLPQDNLVNAPKRLCDLPVQVTYAMFSTSQAVPGTTIDRTTSSVKRFRERSNELTEGF